MADIITIRNLEVWTHIGVPDEERAAAQKLRITVAFKAPAVAEAAASDDLAKSVDYFQVAERIKAVAAERPRKLIETLAEELAQKLLTGFKLKRISLEIRKFILPDAEWVGIAIERKAKKAKAQKRSKIPKLPKPPKLKIIRPISRPRPFKTQEIQTLPPAPQA
jgi:dihydroneopterin aldolase